MKITLFNIIIIALALAIVYYIMKDTNDKFVIMVDGKPTSFVELILSKKEIKGVTNSGYPTTPKKSKNKSENNCRDIVERIIGQPFPSARPDFLKSPMTGRNLELDMYNPQLKLAFEYNGVQHYKYTPHFHRNGIYDFEKQKLHDNFKNDVCKRKGIRLISIPYTIKENDREEWIRNAIRQL